MELESLKALFWQRNISRIILASPAAWYAGKRDGLNKRHKKLTNARHLRQQNSKVYEIKFHTRYDRPYEFFKRICQAKKEKFGFQGSKKWNITGPTLFVDGSTSYFSTFEFLEPCSSFRFAINSFWFVLDGDQISKVLILEIIQSFRGNRSPRNIASR